MANLAQFDDDTFDAEVLESDLPVLVDFFATWCPPCKMLAPIVESLAGELAGRLKVGKVDVDDAQGLAGRYGINAVPTMILFKGGEPVDRITGLLPKAELRRRVESQL